MQFPFVINPGVITDDTTFASPGFYTSGINIRFRLGKPQSIGGWEALMEITDDPDPVQVAGICRVILPYAYLSPDGPVIQVAFGTHTHLMVSVGTGYGNEGVFDITPDENPWNAGGGNVNGAGVTFDEGSRVDGHHPTTWSLSNYGDWLIACARDDAIYYWDNDENDLAIRLEDADNSGDTPSPVNFALATPQRQVLALGCTEEVSGDFNPMCIRGSDIEDIFEWNVLDSNNAFEDVLESGSELIAAAPFGDALAVWTDTSVYLGTFIGEFGQTYRWDLISAGCGLIGPNTFAIMGNVAFWIGRDRQFWAWPLGGVPQILACPVRKDFTDNIAEFQEYKIQATTITQYGEVWFQYPDARENTGTNKENSRGLIFNTQENVWSTHNLIRPCLVDAGVNQYPLGADASGNVFEHEKGTSANGASWTATVRSSPQYLDEGQRHMMVRGIKPDIEGQTDPINLRLYTYPYPQGAETVKGPYSLTVGADKKDFRVSGALIAVEFSITSDDLFFRLGKPVFDFVPTGER